MSDAHDDHHDAAGHHAPPPLPEPSTPMWLPALGAALFVLAGVWWVAMPHNDASAEAGANGDAGVVAASATP
jgi:hypothetical protein